jgi:hypothetical protein
MPDDRPRINRPAKAEHEQDILQWHEAIAESLKILRESQRPDVFLGRRSYDPFPNEETD